MVECSLVRNLEIVKGNIEDYRRLGVYHYRDCRCGPYAAIFTMKAVGKLAVRLGDYPVGVIVYTMPAAGLELRGAALGGILKGLDSKSRLSFINKNIRTISRVVIEPRFRSLGLAARLVRETIEKVSVPIVESLAVMGQVNNFFERAGMMAYKGPRQLRTVQLIEAFDFVGIGESELSCAEAVQGRMDNLPGNAAEFIEGQIRSFLQCYGNRRNMQGGIERTGYVLSRLTERPIYYIKIKSQKSKIKIEEGEDAE